MEGRLYITLQYITKQIIQFNVLQITVHAL